MKLSLNTWQRQMLVVALGQVSGYVSEVRKALKALDILELTAEEEMQVGFRTLPDGGFLWDDQDHIWELEIKDRGACTVTKRAAENFQGWPVAQAHLMEDLFAQLGIEQREESNVRP